MKAYPFVVLLFLALVLYSNELQATSCWTTVEIAKMGEFELEGKIALSFKDAVNCQPLQNAQIETLGRIYQTDLNGTILFDGDLFDKMEDENIPLIITKKGYIPLHAFLQLRLGSVLIKHFLLTKELPIHSMRFVLQWGKTPLDLDLHLKADNFHISYRNIKYATSQANLDRDSIRGFGPETITLDRVTKSKAYSVFVHRYSPTGRIDSRGMVQVYRNNKLDRTMILPETDYRYVEILKIQNNKIEYLNRAAKNLIK
jgi:hypothetical protein